MSDTDGNNEQPKQRPRGKTGVILASVVSAILIGTAYILLMVLLIHRPGQNVKHDTRLNGTLDETTNYDEDTTVIIAASTERIPDTTSVEPTSTYRQTTLRPLTTEEATTLRPLTTEEATTLRPLTTEAPIVTPCEPSASWGYMTEAHGARSGGNGFHYQAPEGHRVSAIQFCESSSRYSGVIGGFDIFFSDGSSNPNIGCLYNRINPYPLVEFQNDEIVNGIDVYATTAYGIGAVGAITIHTNMDVYGPYGRPESSEINSLYGRQLIGIHGGVGGLLDKVGFIFERCL